VVLLELSLVPVDVPSATVVLLLLLLLLLAAVEDELPVVVGSTLVVEVDSPTELPLSSGPSPDWLGLQASRHDTAITNARTPPA